MTIKHNFQLQPYNSFNTEAIATLFAEVDTVDSLIEVLTKHPNEEKLILGNGCNLFFTKNFDGLVIKPTIRGIEIVNETDKFVDIEVGAGEDWDQLAKYCVNRNWAGIENLSYIPGSVGAAPIQNIGAYGTEVKDVILEVNTIEISTAQAKTFKNGDCNFEYRNSLFKQTRNYVITSVVFRLSKTFTYHEKYIDLKNELSGIQSPTLSQVREAIINIRKRKLPNHIEIPNAGSFFKNPIIDAKQKEQLIGILPNAPVYDAGKNLYKTSAAYLIEQAGYKGKTNNQGNVGTYQNHALIIVNHGTSNGNDISNFKQEIQDAVKSKFGIALEPEVWIF